MKNRIVKSLIAFILISLLMLPSGGFAVLAAEASADLVGISVGNLSIADFDAATTSYDVKVPYTYTPNNFTTVATPVVKAYALDPNANVTVTQPLSADGGLAEIVVENGGNTKTYTVNLSTAAMNLAKDGGFEDGATYNYYRWSLGFVSSLTDTFPYAGSKAFNHSNTTWSPVSVYAESGVQVKKDNTYLVTYYARDVENSGLSWYASNKGSYSAKTYYSADGIPGTSDYLGKLSSTTWTKVVQTYVPSADSAVTSLAYGPITMAAAKPIELDEMYIAPLAVTNIEYDGETSVAIPADAAKSISISGKLKNQIGGTCGLENETVEYRLLSAPEGVTLDGTTLTVGTNASEGSALVEMSATLGFANGFQTKVASIKEISIYSLENENLPKLSGIAVGNLSIPDFNPNTTSYDFKVPYTYIPNNFTTVTIPEIKAYAEDPEATVTVTQPESADGKATIIVTKGEYSRTYTVNLSTAAMNQYGDGGMETATGGTDNWATYNRWSLGYSSMGTMSTDYPKAGNQAFRLSVKDYVIGAAPSGASLDAGKTYLLTFYTREPGNNNISWYAGNSGLPSDVVKSYYNEDGSLRGGDSLGKLTSEWTRVIQTHKATQTSKSGVRFGPINFNAAYEIELDEAYFSELAVTDIAYTGDKKILIPEEGKNTGAVSAKLINQIGGSHGLENEVISYRLISAPEGVELSGNTFTVNAGASEGTALIEMTSNLSFANGFQTKVASIEEIQIAPDNRSEIAEALDIQVGKLSIPDFDSKKSEYDMIVPYSYKANDFDEPDMPRVRVIPRDADADVVVEYPEEVDGGVVTVTITSGEYTKEYKINFSYAAVNEAVDGGMETGEWVAYNSDTIGMVFGGLTPDMAKAGNRSFEFYLKASWGQLMVNPNSGFNMSAGVKYLLSYYLRAKDEDFTLYASNDKLPSDKVVKHYNDDGSAKGGDSTKLTTTDWTHVVQTYSTATGGSGARFAPTGVANKSMYMDEYYFAPLTATDVVLTGTKHIEKLESGSVSIPLSAKLINQIGGTHGLENEAVTFELVGDYEGVSLSGNTLTITSDAPVGSVPVRAKSTFKNGSQQNVWDIVEFDIIDKTADLTITLSESEVVPGEIEASVFTKGIGKKLILSIALYEETENGPVLEYIDNITASLESDGVIKARVYADVPDDGKDYTVKSFLWDENLAPVIAPAIIE